MFQLHTFQNYISLLSSNVSTTILVVHPKKEIHEKVVPKEDSPKKQEYPKEESPKSTYSPYVSSPSKSN